MLSAARCGRNWPARLPGDRRDGQAPGPAGRLGRGRRCTVFDAALLFGRYTQSGWGREMGYEVLQDYTEVKAVTTQL